MEDVKILVVDDEARMRKLVKDFLSVKGFIVLEAEDGEEALKVFDANKDIKLILLDVMMPKLDGFETLEVIRQYSKVPVMMLTARSEERDELEAISSEWMNILQSLFHLRYLLPELKRYLEEQWVSLKKN